MLLMVLMDASSSLFSCCGVNANSSPSAALRDLSSRLLVKVLTYSAAEEDQDSGAQTLNV